MNILLVDDHVLFREGVASLLNAQPDMTVLGEAANVQEAIAKARQLQPDTILMDISMPDGSGVDATRAILAEAPETTIIFLTVHEDDERLFEAIRCGGRGYLLKNMRTAELLEMLRGLQRGEAAISRKLAGRILAEFSKTNATEHHTAVGPETQLTTRELEILNLVAAGASNKEIANDLVISISTVKNHMRNILKKLNLKNRREAAAFVKKRGLL